MIQNDTIIALATPAGVGAISVIRLSGENAIHFVEANFKSIRKNKSLLNQKTHTIHLGHIIENNIILGTFFDFWAYMYRSSAGSGRVRCGERIQNISLCFLMSKLRLNLTVTAYLYIIEVTYN